MPRSPKARIALLRRQLAIPRDDYLAAVTRHERRARAKFHDPSPVQNLLKKALETRRLFAEAAGDVVAEPSDTHSTRRADPALLDCDEDIVHDERLISFYLADNPFEPRRPMARGRNHEELLDSWLHSTEGKEMIARRERSFALAIERLGAKLSTRGND